MSWALRKTIQTRPRLLLLRPRFFLPHLSHLQIHPRLLQARLVAVFPRATGKLPVHSPCFHLCSKVLTPPSDGITLSASLLLEPSPSPSVSRLRSGGACRRVAAVGRPRGARRDPSSPESSSRFPSPDPPAPRRGKKRSRQGRGGRSQKNTVKTAVLSVLTLGMCHFPTFSAFHQCVGYPPTCV